MCAIVCNNKNKIVEEIPPVNHPHQKKGFKSNQQMALCLLVCIDATELVLFEDTKCQK